MQAKLLGVKDKVGSEVKTIKGILGINLEVKYKRNSATFSEGIAIYRHVFYDRGN